MNILFSLPSVTVFVGAFLLFSMQPMLGRTLLSVFGGTASIWVVCLATFQFLLLAGYFYAHLLTAKRGWDYSSQGRLKRVHVIGLAFATLWLLAFAYLRPTLFLHLDAGAHPVACVFACVIACMGLPYLLLSANSTLIQAWVIQWQISNLNQDGVAQRRGCGEEKASNVYHLYAVSNAGSLLGLLCYPFLIEPFIALSIQWYGFAACFGLYTTLMAFLAQGSKSIKNSDQHCDLNVREIPAEGAFHSSEVVLWLLLPATSTFLLNAVTAHLSMDVTPIPLLWVALLASFLLSYILGFSKIGELGLCFWCVLTLVPLLFCSFALAMVGHQGFIFSLTPGLLLILFGCTFLHGWLFRTRPKEQWLTRFYLCIAIGGAVGGVLSGIVAPVVFTRVWEYPIALVGVTLFLGLYAWKSMAKEFRWMETLVYSSAIIVLFLIFNGMKSTESGISVLHRLRSFYGCLVVQQQDFKIPYGDPIEAHRIMHGNTLHGVQFLPHYLRERPTSYYGPYGGGFSILTHASYTNNLPMRVGLVGLGAGTMACYGRTNDIYRFFEINPQVVEIARNTNYFTYLSTSKAQVSIALGDARTLLSAETNRYDVLVIDAYSGDAIPFHLATKEAFRLYLDRLNPGGVLAVHISNWHIDLNPLCKAVAREWNLQLTGLISKSEGLLSDACWVFLSAHHLSSQGLSVRETDWSQVRNIMLPTDACGSLISLIRYGYRTPMKPLEIDLSKIY